MRKTIDGTVRYRLCAMGALDNGRLPLDNNLAERDVGDMHSIMITAKMNGLNPRNYVHWLLEETPIVDNPGGPACLASLMP